MINLILKISKHLPNQNIGAYLIKMQQKYSKIQAPKNMYKNLADGKNSAHAENLAHGKNDTGGKCKKSSIIKVLII
jgi:hypothetical protein